MPDTKSEPLFSVLIAHGEPLTRVGLATAIGGHQDFRICGEADSAASACFQCEHHHPDAIVLDADLDAGGTYLLRELVRSAPATRVVVCGDFVDTISILRLFSAGAYGFVSRLDFVPDLVATLANALRGRRQLGPQAEHKLLEEFATGRLSISNLSEDSLSDRELQVFRMIGTGERIYSIAAKLGVSRKTVETHRQRIKRKLGLGNSAELARRAAVYCHFSSCEIDFKGGRPIPAATSSGSRGTSRSISG